MARTAEENRARCKAWHAANRERVRAYKKAKYIRERDTQLARSRAWREANPERNKELTRSNWLKNRYGLSRAEYNAQLVAQEGVCAICGRTNANGKELSVDHSHATGKLRALLCAACNQGLGAFQDDPQLLVHAARYLQLGGRIHLARVGFSGLVAPKEPRTRKRA